MCRRPGEGNADVLGRPGWPESAEAILAEVVHRLDRLLEPAEGLGADRLQQKPFTFMPISSQSWSYSSLPPNWNQETNAMLSIPTPAPATGEPNSMAAGCLPTSSGSRRSRRQRDLRQRHRGLLNADNSAGRQNLNSSPPVRAVTSSMKSRSILTSVVWCRPRPRL